jgi:hypothetical protein
VRGGAGVNALTVALRDTPHKTATGIPIRAVRVDRLAVFGTMGRWVVYELRLDRHRNDSLGRY